MHHLKSPPLRNALALVRPLEAAGIECALGGSGLLAALGLGSEVRDWDLTTDVPWTRSLDVLWRALPADDRSRGPASRARRRADLGAVLAGTDELHADHKLMFPELHAELIHHFAFYMKGNVVHVPTRVSGRWKGIPLGSPEGWAIAYDLMGRDAKAELLFGRLAERGADARRVAELLDQPLPSALARRLRSLPVTAAAASGKPSRAKATRASSSRR